MRVASLGPNRLADILPPSLGAEPAIVSCRAKSVLVAHNVHTKHATSTASKNPPPNMLPLRNIAELVQVLILRLASSREVDAPDAPNKTPFNDADPEGFGRLRDLLGDVGCVVIVVGIIVSQWRSLVSESLHFNEDESPQQQLFLKRAANDIIERAIPSSASASSPSRRQR